MNGSVGIMGLFLEGLLSFFSPCVLPLVPLYISYLTAGIQDYEDVKKRRIETVLRTFFFVLGISTVFFLAGLGSSALHQFFTKYTLYFYLIGGIVLILFGLFSLGVLRIPFLERERKVQYQIKGSMNYFQAFLLGFFFSFAWSPCVGPLLATAIMTAAQASTRLLGWLYIGAYTLGFISIFILIGLFTEEVLGFLKKNKNVVKYTKLLGGIVVVGMGCYMLWQGTKTINGMMQKEETPPIASGEQEEVPSSTSEEAPTLTMEDVNFKLMNAEGKEVQLTDYKGQKVLVNFFGTWCHYCNEELPDLIELNNTREDIKILMITTPNLGQEKDKQYIIDYLKEKGSTIELLFDEDYSVLQTYGVSGFPSTYFFESSGEILGYVPGYVPKETLENIVSEMR